MTNEEKEKIREDCLQSLVPGKFEGEQIYSPYYYGQILEGGGAEEFYFGEGEPAYSLIIVSAEDREIFPEIGQTFGFCCWETEQGFWNCIPLETKAEYDAEFLNLEKQAEECQEEES